MDTFQPLRGETIDVCVMSLSLDAALWAAWLCKGTPTVQQQQLNTPMVRRRLPSLRQRWVISTHFMLI